MNRNDILFYLKYDIIPAQEFLADPEYWRETIRLLEGDSIRSEPQQNLSAEQILFAPLARCGFGCQPDKHGSKYRSACSARFLSRLALRRPRNHRHKPMPSSLKSPHHRLATGTFRHGRLIHQKEAELGPLAAPVTCPFALLGGGMDGVKLQAQ